MMYQKYMLLFRSTYLYIKFIDNIYFIIIIVQENYDNSSY